MSLLVFVFPSACIHVKGNVQQLHFQWSVVENQTPPTHILMTLNYNQSKYRGAHTRSLLPPLHV